MKQMEIAGDNRVSFLTEIKKQRSLAVFVSSTFEDMKAERDMMMTRVFPRIRKLCEQRGVTWNEIDLRWGITDEQKEKGQVLPICLRRIDDCRPVFIGLLGERYGWIPKEAEIPEEELKQKPWLAQYIGRSMTELEMLHGVFNHLDEEGYSFFYLRDAAYSDDHPDVWEQTEEEREKLQQLKNRIHQEAEQHHLCAQEYTQLKHLEELLLADLTAMVNTLFPLDEQVDPAVQEEMEHEMYVRNRARVYIERSGEEAEITRFMEKEQTTPFLVRGESGIGKSSFLAHWGRKWQEHHPNDLVLMHFVGANGYYTDLTAMVKSIIQRLSARTKLELSLPEKAEECQEKVTEAFHRVAEHINGTVVVVIDGLNQLVQDDGSWLPVVLPSRMKLILGTLEGPTMNALQQKGWDKQGAVVRGLEREEREQLIVHYLSLYGKELAPHVVQTIAQASQTANPLYLRFLLDEIRLYGKHEELEAVIERYLQSSSIEELLTQMFRRVQETFETDRKGLVNTALSLIYASKKGLDEHELAYLLGDGKEPISSAIWSPLYLSLEGAFHIRSGLINFSHDFVRKAVGQEYMKSEQERQHAHDQLIIYFSQEEMSKRSVEEWLWQLFQNKQWEKLSGLLATPEILEIAWKQDKYEVLNYWSEIENHSSIRKQSIYQNAIVHPSHYGVLFLNICFELFFTTSCFNEALRLCKYLQETAKLNNDKKNLTTYINNLASIYQNQWELDEALTMYKENEKIIHELGDLDRFATNLNNQAGIYEVRGELSKALEMFEKAEKIAREIGNRKSVRTYLSNQASILKDFGDISKALERYEEAESIAREIGDRESIASILNGQGIIYKRLGELSKALRMYQEAEKIVREIGNRQSRALYLNNQVLIYVMRGELSRALAMSEEAGKIAWECGNRKQVAMSLNNQAAINEKWGDLSKALAMYEEAENMAREIGDLELIATCVNNQAFIYRKRGDLSKALAMYEEAEKVVRKIGNLAMIATSINNRAFVYEMSGETSKALALYEESETIFRELGYQDEFATCLNNQAMILKKRGEMGKALEMLQEAEKMAREIGDRESIATYVNNQALIYKARGELDQALKMFKKSEEILREVGGELQNLAAILHNQASVYEAQGEIDRALELYKEAEGIVRDIEDESRLALILGDQALIYKIREELDRALEMSIEAEEIIRRMGDNSNLATCLNNQGELYVTKGQLDEALEKFIEMGEIVQGLDDQDSWASCLYKQGMVYKIRGELVRAIELYKEAEDVNRELGRQIDLVKCLNNQALIYQEIGNLNKALEINKEAVEILQTFDEKQNLLIGLYNQGLIYRAQGEVGCSLEIFEQVEEMARELDEREMLANCLNNQAVIYAEMKQYSHALPLMEETLEIRRDLEDIENLEDGLTNLFYILEHGKMWHRAIQTLEKWEAIYLNCNNQKGINWCLQKRISLFDLMGKAVGRNESCPCGSGKKYKKCHGK